MSKDRERALFERYGVRFDSEENRWLSAYEWLEKHYGVRFDEDKGRWITTENNHHVHLNEEGEPDKGNPHVIAAMEGKDTEPQKASGAKHEAAIKTIESANAKMKEIRERAKTPMRDLEQWRRSVAGYEEQIADFDDGIKDAQKGLEKIKKLRDERLAQQGLSLEGVESELAEIKKERKEIDDWLSEDFRNRAYSEEGRAKRERYNELGLRESTLKRLAYRREIEQQEQIISYYEKRKAETESKLEEERKNDPSKELETFRAEYDKAAKARDAAVLEAFPTAKDLETASEATDYIRAKGYFRADGESALDADERVDVSLVGDWHAQIIAEHLDRLMEDYPWAAGKLGGVGCRVMTSDGTYAATNPTTGLVSFNRTHYGNSGDIESKYSDDVHQGYHPEGTTHEAILDHEMTHALEIQMNRTSGKKAKAADTVMHRVCKRLGRSASADDQQEVREMLCTYAGRNKGVYRDKQGKLRVNSDYGKNTEFLAEAMAEARCSDHPRELATIVREEFEKLMKEQGLM